MYYRHIKTVAASNRFFDVLYDVHFTPVPYGKQITNLLALSNIKGYSTLLSGKIDISSVKGPYHA
jgi:hypothetical protein